MSRSHQDASRVESLCRMAIACPMYAEHQSKSRMDVRINGVTYRLLVPQIPGEFFIDGFETNTIEECIALQSSWTHVPRESQPESDHDSSRHYPLRVLRARALRRFLSSRS